MGNVGGDEFTLERGEAAPLPRVLLNREGFASPVVTLTARMIRSAMTASWALKPYSKPLRVFMIKVSGSVGFAL
jgi:hypothetical protein